MSEPEGPVEPALHLADVGVSFAATAGAVCALDDITLTVMRGSVTGLVGPDGAGKTTLMRVAAGLIAPDQGSVQALGSAVGTAPSSMKAQIGYMPQRFGLYEELTVAENLDLYGDLQGVTRRHRTQHYEALLGMTGLAPFLGRLAGKLSGGMKRKLGLACALVRTPQLLLLDEPTVGVDPVSRRELWAIVERLVREAQVSVLVSTAYLDETERCDAVFVLDRGRVIGNGPPAAFTQRMVGRVHAARPTTESLRVATAIAAAHPEVVDASPERGRVRIVSRTARVPGGLGKTDRSPAYALAPVTPRFEDYFMDALSRAHPGGPERRATLAHRDQADSEDIVIEVDEVWRRFGQFDAVKGVSFSVRRGEVFGLLGANGAGKSTLFRMLCGLLPASAGRLRVGGVDMRQAPAAARTRLGYVAQHFSLYGNITVAQNLRFFAAAYGLSRRQRVERVRQVMDDFELLDRANVESNELPLGYRQRLALAGALMHQPEILFLDEATSGVDPLARREFWRRINTLASAGVTVLVTTHFMEEAEYCDRLVIMESGSILAAGSPDSIRARARTGILREPTMEDAFCALIDSADRATAA